MNTGCDPTARERFLAVMAFEPVDRPPLWEMGYWCNTIARWRTEGLEKLRPDPPSSEDFGRLYGVPVSVRAGYLSGVVPLDPRPKAVPINYDMRPGFPEETIAEDAETQTVRTRNGLLLRQRKDGASIPQFAGWPVATRDDFERVKPFYDPDDPQRLPANWPQLIEEYRDRDYPLLVGGAVPVGMFGWARELMGIENLLYAFSDDPELVDDIVDFMTGFTIAVWDRAIRDVRVDYAYIWEDMAYRGGPIVSPATFRRFFLPAYQRLTGFLRDSGVDIILVDSDGNCSALIPLWIEGGVNVLFPLEAQAGMDPQAVRERFPRLRLFGGIDKRALALGPEAIDAELRRKLPLVKHGGFIPQADHSIPPDVSWENYRYYRRRLGELVGE
ncbi:MAG: hypothetical protein HYY04_14975 [Chloroflexi bacterium]|nr:hypothetical protein [Chloroflexota bacterium]